MQYLIFRYSTISPASLTPLSFLFLSGKRRNIVLPAVLSQCETYFLHSSPKSIVFGPSRASEDSCHTSQRAVSVLKRSHVNARIFHAYCLLLLCDFKHNRDVLTNCDGHFKHENSGTPYRPVEFVLFSADMRTA